MTNYSEKLFNLILDLDSCEDHIKYMVSYLRAEVVNYADGTDVDMLEMEK